MITPPRYKRIEKMLFLKAKKCENCGAVYLSERNYCGDCGRKSRLKEIDLPRQGIVDSSTVIHVGYSDLQMNKKTPYGFGLIKYPEMNFKVTGLIDTEKRATGEKVSARIGKLGETDEGLKIYSYIWEQKKEFHKPEKRKKVGSKDISPGVGIEGYGVYVPKFRIKSEEISEIWGKDVKNLVKSLPGKWDDTASYAMNAALDALEHAEVSGEDIEFIEIGSESHPYIVKPTATIIGELINSHKWAGDNEFACKAGTQAMFNAINSVEAKRAKHGLAIGADSAQCRPGDVLEYEAADGGAAFIIGDERPVAVLEGCDSYSSDTIDFRRNEKDEFPVHEERYTGEPAYFRHIETAVNNLLEKLNLKTGDIDYFIPHQPNPKFPRKVAKNLGFTKEQVNPGIVADWIGNTYSACSLLGLAKVLDESPPGKRILLCSYGSGAGADAFSFITTKEIDKKRENIKRSVKSWLGEEDSDYLKFVSYGKYAKLKGILKE